MTEVPQSASISNHLGTRNLSYSSIPEPVKTLKCRLVHSTRLNSLALLSRDVIVCCTSDPGAANALPFIFFFQRETVPCFATFYVWPW